MTDKKNTPPFKIHGIDPRGLTVCVDPGVDPIVARSVTLLPGDEIEITAAILAANRDRNGNTILELTEAAQRERWGRLRFGVGSVSESVRATLNAERAAALKAERDNLLRSNPALAKATAAALRLRELDAQISRLSA